MSDCIYYAIGDVHGEKEKLDRLLDFIREDARLVGAAYRIVLLGDLVDRGPDSRAVVAFAMAAEQRGEAITVKGNHEELMLHAYDRPDPADIFNWTNNGGGETIVSYQIANGLHGDWRDSVDKDHIRWMRALPTIVRDEVRGIAFVHGGIDPVTFPNCSDEVRMWTRSPKFFDPGRWPKRPELEGLLVVHGHTPTHDFRPHANPRRVNVDTGACYGGPLTSVVLAPGEGPRFLYA